MALKLPVALYKSVISSKITATATTIPVDSFEIYEGQTLTNGQVYGFIIDEGKSSEEFVIGTVDIAGSQLTSCLRGVSPVDGITEVSALKQIHRRTAKIKITDHPYVVSAIRALNGTDVLGGTLKYPSSRTISDPRHLVDKEALDAAAGAAGGITAFLVSQNGADPSLTINVGSGTWIHGRIPVTYAGAAAQAVSAASTNYVQLKWDGTLVINTTGFLDGHLPLATVTTSGTDITGITDNRVWLTNPQSLPEVIEGTLGEAVSGGVNARWVVQDYADGKWYLAKSDEYSRADGKIGYALTTGSLDGVVAIQTSGVVSGVSGLTPGPVYVQDTEGTIGSSIGTRKRYVGDAQLGGTTVTLQPSLPISRASGTPSGMTDDFFSAMMGQFITPYTNALRRSLTSGHKLASGMVAAIESDGSVYRVRQTAIGTPGGSSTLVSSEVQDGSHPVFHYKISDTQHCLFWKNANGAGSTVVSVAQIVLTAAGAYSSVTVTDLSVGGSTVSGDVSAFDVTPVSSTSVLVAYTDGTGVEAKIVGTLDGTLAQGTIVVVDANANHPVCEVNSTSDLIVWWVDTSGTNIKYRTYSVSGTTLTPLISATDFIVTANSVRLGDAKKVTTDTFIVGYVDDTASLSYGAVATLNTTTHLFSTVGTPVSTGNDVDGRIQMDMATGSTSVGLLTYVHNNGTHAQRFSVSGTTPTFDTRIDLTGLSPASDLRHTMVKMAGYSWAIGITNGSSSDDYAIYYVSFDSDLSTLTQAASLVLTSGYTVPDDTPPALFPVSPTKAFFFCSDNGNTVLQPVTMTSNIAGVLGIVETTVASATSTPIIVAGYSNELSGLTAATTYYPDVDGFLTTSSLDRNKIAIATSATEVDVSK